MGRSMNTVNLIGRLTKDIDLRYTPNGTAVAKFILAVNRRFKKDGQPEADFINCQIWNKQAENLSFYTHKGSLIGVTGRLMTGSYENQQGQKVYTTDVVVEQFTFLETKKNTQSPERDNQLNNDFGFDITDDDLPF